VLKQGLHVEDKKIILQHQFSMHATVWLKSGTECEGAILSQYTVTVTVTVTVSESMRSMRSMRGGLFPVVEGPCKRYAVARHVLCVLCVLCVICVVCVVD
jgi:hypothetical protein